jgi:hypothetical protein
MRNYQKAAEMKLAIMQPYVFPYIGYFQLINSVDKFVILDDVNFIMRGWINRNRILVNGTEHLFSVPVTKASQNNLIYKCELDDCKWKIKFLKTLEFSYKKAPYYRDCINSISAILLSEEKNLSTWLTFQLKQICSYLNIKTLIVETSRLYSNHHLKAQTKIIDICRQEKAAIYYNAIGGRDLYNTLEFKRNNIELKFLKTEPVSYSQGNGEFIPFLSIIDVMMFNSVNSIQGMLNKFELI